MKTTGSTGSLIMVACVALLCGCAATAPSELTGARMAYKHASTGPAAQLAPTDLHRAQVALALAEKSFKKDADSYRTRDLAYVAQRKAETADAQASIATEQNSKARSDNAYNVTQGNILQEKTQDLSQAREALAVSERNSQATAERLAAEQQARLEAERRAKEQSALMEKKAQDLNQTRTALAVSERNSQATAEQLAAEQEARLEAEKKASDAQAALAKLAAIEDERGLVITLSGSVLFRSGDAVLMGGAQTRLDQVVDALLATPGRKIAVEGFTDSQGSNEYNMDLSQRRADAVRDYLVHGGLSADRVHAHGIGEERPIADNATSEGRANNRRVEIVLEREDKL
jgi:outer membrane protein OmpA-like peptidoglycan-associated protein